MIIAWRFGKFHLFLIISLECTLNYVYWYDPLMVAVFTFLYMFMCYDQGIESIRCKVKFYDYLNVYKVEGFILISNIMF